MESKFFGIVLDEQNFLKLKLEVNCTLTDLRLKLKTKIKKKFVFVDKENYTIDQENEEDFTIKDLTSDDKIRLKTIENNEIKEEIKLNIRPKNVPLENSDMLEKIGKLKIFKYPRIDFTPTEKALENTILIVGQTGSGKTSFINSFINYLMDIDIDDDFRYSLVVEKKRIKSESQTKGIHIYNIRSKRMLLRIVDTQGFVDTKGINEDEKITLAIKESFMNELNSLNAVLFVVKSSDTRLTIHQKYVFNSIISLFGKDIQNNFLVLVTFQSRNQKPPVITTLENSDFKTIIPYIQNPWYLCFDNTIITSDPDDEENRIPFKKVYNNYKILCDRIITLNRNSLTQTKKNLDLRAKIEMKSKALLELLRMQMDKLGAIKDQKEYIEANEKGINEKKITFIPQKKIEYEPEQLPDGEKATICKICKFNCHHPCRDTRINGVDILKYTCQIWTWGFDCTMCPNKCPQSCHELSDKIFQRKEKTEFIKVEQMVDKKLVDNVNMTKNILVNLEKEEKNLKDKIKVTQEEIRQNFTELKKIAINYTKYITTKEFLEDLIGEEERVKEEGYKMRISLYKNMIEENDIILKNIQI